MPPKKFECKMVQRILSFYITFILEYGDVSVSLYAAICVCSPHNLLLGFIVIILISINIIMGKEDEEITAAQSSAAFF